MLTRRAFLRSAATAVSMGATWRLWAAQGTPSARFLLVFLRGACDGLSVLVPYKEPFYYEMRPHIAIPPPVTGGATGQAAVALDGRWALHPTMADELFPLWEAGQLAFVPFAGTGFVSRSHFQAQDWIEFGQRPGASPDTSNGFLNRLLAELGTTSDGVSFTTTLPEILQGGVRVANAPLTGKGKRGPVLCKWEQRVQEMYAGHPIESLARDGIGLRREIAAELREEMQAASREAAPADSFAVEAGRVGRLLRERPQYSVGFVDIGGWDTHAGQGGVSGALATRLDALASGLGQLATALGPREWDRTVVVVLTEFGRTFRENGSRGTDHGHGTTLMVLGGQVRGGAVRGSQAGLGRGQLHEDRDVPVINEYRAMLAGLYGRMYGLSETALDRVLPGARAIDLGLL